MTETKEEILNDLTDMIRHHTNVINDPMNGCPEDFSEDYTKIENRKIWDARNAGATEEEIGDALSKGYWLAEGDFGEL